MKKNTYAAITNYNFPTSPYSEIRVTKQDGTVWFAVEDICKATGIIPQRAMENIDPAHHGSFVIYVYNDNGTEEIDMVSFTRLQVIVARANTVQARRFLSWVETEIMGMEDDQEDKIDLTDTVGHDNIDDQPVDMRTFNFKNSYDHDIRTIIKEDGFVWFVAKDVCDVLELQNSRQAIAVLDDDEKGVSNTYTLGGNQKLSIISESGLYALIFKSRKPEAKKFRKWVTSEVLPQIRRTGTYMPVQHGSSQELPPAPDHVDPAPAHPAISPKAITAFLQASTDTFWAVERALNEYKAMESSLKKARKDAAVIIRSIKQAFPDSNESIDMLGGMDAPSLEVEMR